MCADPASHVSIIDLSSYLADKESAAEDARAVADGLERTGLLFIRDPRVPSGLPDKVLSQMERYFRLPEAVKRTHERATDGHQVGWTPPLTEMAGEKKDLVEGIPETDRPAPLTGRDVKERFMFPIGLRPSRTPYPKLNSAERIIPEGFPHFAETLDEWGSCVLRAVFTVTEMAAIGFGCRHKNLFTQYLAFGPHLFAPTGTDLSQHGKPGTLLAGRHNDTGFLTAHGRANYPGLFAWTRDKRRFPVRVPEGCLLLQSGRQFQILTGGRVHPGLHEVLAVPEMESKIQEDLASGLVPYRTTTTLFCHVASHRFLEPIDVFATPEAVKRFPPVTAGERLTAALKRRGLANPHEDET